jgi:hypothetical protein
VVGNVAGLFAFVRHPRTYPCSSARSVPVEHVVLQATSSDKERSVESHGAMQLERHTHCNNVGPAGPDSCPSCDFRKPVHVRHLATAKQRARTAYRNGSNRGLRRTERRPLNAPKRAPDESRPAESPTAPAKSDRCRRRPPARSAHTALVHLECRAARGRPLPHIWKRL